MGPLGYIFLASLMSSSSKCDKPSAPPSSEERRKRRYAEAHGRHVGRLFERCRGEREGVSLRSEFWHRLVPMVLVILLMIMWAGLTMGPESAIALGLMFGAAALMMLLPTALAVVGLSPKSSGT